MSKIFFAIAGAMALMLAASVLLQPAFAHGRFTLPVTDAPVQGRQAVMVIGHTNEPTFAVERGVHNGLHGLEISLSDFDTKMPLAGAQLKADKFYFKDMASFNAADSVNDADEVVNGTSVGATFGSPGFYQIRQLVTEGIYGYRIYGTINYFDVASVPVDVTAFCRSSEGNTTKFNSPGFAGGYGCVDDIDTLAFPEGVLESGTGDKAVIKVVAVSPEGQELGMFAKLRQGSKVVTQGFTPFYFQGKPGETYKVSMANFEDRKFERWDDGSKSRDRTVTLEQDVTLTAHYSKGTAINATAGPQGKAQVAIPVGYSVAGGQSQAAVQGPGPADGTLLLQLLGIGLPAVAAAVFGLRYMRK
jgi:hypothetical protein